MTVEQATRGGVAEPLLGSLTLALGGWGLLASAASPAPSSPRYLFAALGLATGAYVVARRAAPTTSAAWAVAVLAAGLVVGELTLGCCPGPLDYYNAGAAVAVQGAAAAGLVAVTTRSARERRAALAFGGVLLLYAPYVSAKASTACAVALVVVVLLAVAGHPRSARVAVGLGVAVAVLAVGTTIGLAVARSAGAELPGSVAASLSERRVDLWADAVDLTVERPLTGVGPGRFHRESPTAAGDSDTPQAHSAVLEVAAELGVPAAALLVAVALVLLAPVARSPGPTAAVGAAAWAALVVQSSVDYVADFPFVVGIAVAVVGLASSPYHLG